MMGANIMWMVLEVETAVVVVAVVVGAIVIAAATSTVVEAVMVRVALVKITVNATVMTMELVLVAGTVILRRDKRRM